MPYATERAGLTFEPLSITARRPPFRSCCRRHCCCCCCYAREGQKQAIQGRITSHKNKSGPTHESSLEKSTGMDKREHARNGLPNGYRWPRMAIDGYRKASNSYQAATGYRIVFDDHRSLLMAPGDHRWPSMVAAWLPTAIDGYQRPTHDINGYQKATESLWNGYRRIPNDYR